MPQDAPLAATNLPILSCAATSALNGRQASWGEGLRFDAACTALAFFSVSSRRGANSSMHGGICACAGRSNGEGPTGAAIGAGAAWGRGPGALSHGEEPGA